MGVSEPEGRVRMLIRHEGWEGLESTPMIRVGDGRGRRSGEQPTSGARFGSKENASEPSMSKIMEWGEDLEGKRDIGEACIVSITVAANRV